MASDSLSIIQKCALLTVLVAVHVSGEEPCDKTKCRGPLRYYKDLGCTPVYKNPGDCCAEEYDCSHLKNLANDKCYANGHEYSTGDALRPEDANPCDIACRCMSYTDGPPSFVCAVMDCPFFDMQPNCYNRNSNDQCCPGPMVCLKEGETRPTCEVDGKIYEDGQYFKPKSDPELDCYCKPGYKGENVEPFCKKPNHPHCSPLFRNAENVRKNCAPVFYSSQNPQEDCSVAARCQFDNDTIIHDHDHDHGKSISEEDNKMCQLGNMKMHIGDKLSRNPMEFSRCVKCVCEVPPIPTCRHLDDDECDAID